MMYHDSFPAKLLIAITGRHKGDKLVAAAKAAGARGATILLGRSVADSRFLRLLALSDIDVDLVFILATDETEPVARAVVDLSHSAPRAFRGLLLQLDVEQLYSRALDAVVPHTVGRSEKMLNEHVLIGVIVNAGLGDDVMETARKAGAHGGTILNARGTGREEDVKFFGLKLVPEKEMLIIIAERDTADRILEAVGSLPMLATPGTGIFFTMDVERFEQLGKPPLEPGKN